MRFHPPLLLTLALTLSLGFGCASDDEEEDDDNADSGGETTPDEECLSGTAWVGGNAESTRMNPGQDCLGCHEAMGEADEVTLGGTVYAGATELDDCFGVPGVVLELTDANGDVTQVTSNSAGNFVLLETPIATPYTAKLLFEGRERAMVAMQTDTSCNSCHTETGLNGAPGRILAP